MIGGDTKVRDERRKSVEKRCCKKKGRKGEQNEVAKKKNKQAVEEDREG